MEEETEQAHGRLVFESGGCAHLRRPEDHEAGELGYRDAQPGHHGRSEAAPADGLQDLWGMAWVHESSVGLSAWLKQTQRGRELTLARRESGDLLRLAW
jgi:hypothetical protein